MNSIGVTKPTNIFDFNVKTVSNSGLNDMSNVIKSTSKNTLVEVNTASSNITSFGPKNLNKSSTETFDFSAYTNTSNKANNVISTNVKIDSNNANIPSTPIQNNNLSKFNTTTSNKTDSFNLNNNGTTSLNQTTTNSKAIGNFQPNTGTVSTNSSNLNTTTSNNFNSKSTNSNNNFSIKDNNFLTQNQNKKIINNTNSSTFNSSSSTSGSSQVSSTNSQSSSVSSINPSSSKTSITNSQGGSSSSNTSISSKSSQSISTSPNNNKMNIEGTNIKQNNSDANEDPTKANFANVHELYQTKNIFNTPSMKFVETFEFGKTTNFTNSEKSIIDSIRGGSDAYECWNSIRDYIVNKVGSKSIEAYKHMTDEQVLAYFYEYLDIDVEKKGIVLTNWLIRNPDVGTLNLSNSELWDLYLSSDEITKKLGEKISESINTKKMRTYNNGDFNYNDSNYLNYVNDITSELEKDNKVYKELGKISSSLIIDCQSMNISKTFDLKNEKDLHSYIIDYIEKNNLDPQQVLGVSKEEINSLSDDELKNKFSSFIESLSADIKSLTNLIEYNEQQSKMAGYNSMALCKDFKNYKYEGFSNMLLSHTTIDEKSLLQHIEDSDLNGPALAKNINYGELPEGLNELEKFIFELAYNDNYGCDYLDLIAMTKDENYPEFKDYEKILMFVYEKDGKDAAIEYYKTISPQVKQYAEKKVADKGKKEAQELYDSLIKDENGELDIDSFENWISTSLNGVFDGVVSWAEGVSGWSAGNNATHSVNEYKQMYLLEMLKENESSWNFLDNNYEINTAVGNMIPTIAFSLIDPAIGTMSMFASSGGSSYKNAKIDGLSNEKAFLYGTLSGLSEVSLEKFLGGLPLISDVKVTSAKTYLQSILKEGNEEFVQTYVDTLLQAAVGMQSLSEVDAEQLFKDSIKSGVYGGIIGGEFNLPSLIHVGTSKISNKFNQDNLMKDKASVADSLQKQNISSENSPINNINTITNQKVDKNTFYDSNITSNNLFSKLDSSSTDTKQSTFENYNKSNINNLSNSINSNILEFPGVNNLNIRKNAKNVLSKKYSLAKTSLSLLESLGIYYTKSRYKPLSQNTELLNKCVNEGLYHVTNIENVDKILNSGEIYASGKFTSYSKTKKTFFTAGIPSFENACAFSIYKDKMVALKIKETPENLANDNFKNRYLTDKAITYDGNFDIKNKNVEVVYLGLSLENDNLVYKEMTKEDWTNYNPDFKNTIQNNLNLKFANKLKEYSVALSTEHDLFIKAIKNKINQKFSKVNSKTPVSPFTKSFNNENENNLKTEIISKINTKSDVFIKARQAYIELNKRIHYNLDYIKLDKNGKSLIYNRSISFSNLNDPNVICKGWSELYRELLISIGFKPEDVKIMKGDSNLSHQWVEINLHKKGIIIADATDALNHSIDLSNCKFGNTTNGFLFIDSSFSGKSIANLEKSKIIDFNSFEYKNAWSKLDNKINYNNNGEYFTDALKQAQELFKDSPTYKDLLENDSLTSTAMNRLLNYEIPENMDGYESYVYFNSIKYNLFDLKDQNKINVNLEYGKFNGKYEGVTVIKFEDFNTENYLVYSKSLGKHIFDDYNSFEDFYSSVETDKQSIFLKEKTTFEDYNTDITEELDLNITEEIPGLNNIEENLSNITPNNLTNLDKKIELFENETPNNLIKRLKETKDGYEEIFTSKNGKFIYSDKHFYENPNFIVHKDKNGIEKGILTESVSFENVSNMCTKISNYNEFGNLEFYEIHLNDPTNKIINYDNNDNIVTIKQTISNDISTTETTTDHLNNILSKKTTYKNKPGLTCYTDKFGVTTFVQVSKYKNGELTITSDANNKILNQSYIYTNDRFEQVNEYIQYEDNSQTKGILIDGKILHSKTTFNKNSKVEIYTNSSNLKYKVETKIKKNEVIKTYESLGDYNNIITKITEKENGNIYVDKFNKKTKKYLARSVYDLNGNATIYEYDNNKLKSIETYTNYGNGNYTKTIIDQNNNIISIKNYTGIDSVVNLNPQKLSSGIEGILDLSIDSNKTVKKNEIINLLNKTINNIDIEKGFGTAVNQINSYLKTGDLSNVSRTMLSRINIGNIDKTDLSNAMTILESIDVMDKKYGKGNGLKQLIRYCETNDNSYITNDNDLRNRISSIGVENIKSYIYNSQIDIYKQQQALNEFKNVMSKDKISDSRIVNMLYEKFEEGMKKGDENSYLLLNTLIKLKKSNPNISFIMDPNETRAYFSQSENILVLPKNNVEYKTYDVLFHELGHCLFFNIMDNKIQNNWLDIQERAKIYATNNPLFSNVIEAFDNMDNNNYNLAYNTFLKNINNLGFSDLIEYSNYLTNIYQEKLNNYGKESVREYLKSKQLSDKIINILLDGNFVSASDIAQTEINIEIKKLNEQYVHSMNPILPAISDIIDAVFNGTAKKYNGDDFKNFYNHGFKEYYRERTLESPFNEMIANFTALKMTTNSNDLLVLKSLFGDEFYNTLESTFNQFLNY